MISNNCDFEKPSDCQNCLTKLRTFAELLKNNYFNDVDFKFLDKQTKG